MRWFLVIAALLAAPAGMPAAAPQATEPRLKSIYCEAHRLAEFKDRNTRAIVLVFMSTHCPVVQQYGPRLRELHGQLQSRGVEFLGIYSNAGDDVLGMALHAQDLDLPFPVLLDVQHGLADRYGAEVTGEVMLLDAAFEKRYQGAIDNQYKKRGSLENATEHYLSPAVEQLLSGQRVATPRTEPSGCRIERAEPALPDEPLTFHRDVEPILQRHCQTCHRDGQAAPFPLTSYQEAVDYASTVEEVVQERRMPPWHGILDPKFGQLANDPRLSDDEVRTIVNWVRGGTHRGNTADAPAPRRWPRDDHWTMGQPDFVYKMPTPFRVPATGQLDYQFIRVPLNFAEDRWLRASEVKPGNPAVVHHIGLHVVESGNREFTGFAGMAALFGLTGDASRELNDFVPGDPYNHKVYPSHQAVRLPKHSDLVFEVHYTPRGKPAIDQSMVAVKWADAAPDEEILTAVFRKKRGAFKIPPYHHHYAMQDSYYFEQDVLIDSIRPHFHARGKSFRLELVHRDPKTDEVIHRETVISVPVFDFRWQRTYELQTPLRVAAGTELVATAHFDNSKLNPNNPDPAAEVLWGLQSSDEMFSTRFRYRLAK